ncbi:hypothetical protein ACLB1N_26490 [Escherichia coli]
MLHSLSPGFHTGLLLCSLAFVLFYEAIDGFHDTANARGDRYLYPRDAFIGFAVVMAAVLKNFLGVLLGGLSVAYAIVHMLPTIYCLIWDRLMALPWCLYVAGGDY